MFVELPELGEREKRLMAELTNINPKQESAMAKKSLRAARGALVVNPTIRTKEIARHAKSTKRDTEGLILKKRR